MIYRKQTQELEKDNFENNFRFKSLIIQNEQILKDKSGDSNITDRLI
jgi:hypothetical protein